jgi:hypothetical protein
MSFCGEMARYPEKISRSCGPDLEAPGSLLHRRSTPVARAMEEEEKSAGILPK